MPARDVEILITPENAQWPVYINADTIAVVQEDLRTQFKVRLGHVILGWDGIDLDDLRAMSRLRQHVAQLNQIADALLSFAVDMPDEDDTPAPTTSNGEGPC